MSGKPSLSPSDESSMSLSGDTSHTSFLKSLQSTKPRNRRFESRPAFRPCAIGSELCRAISDNTLESGSRGRNGPTSPLQILGSQSSCSSFTHRRGDPRVTDRSRRLSPHTM
ncbi:hypothetical protein TIFTF001_017758 [Ficus carica]|uniref:Uncharacterized protein n=1 Tax=Ficus carica TaxID=3494 RepID=A0AA88DJ34_FICCA|nr:hypothetical protein TIFTF001_017758 [Ficus carica]